MSAENFVNFIMKKYHESKIKGDKKVKLASIKNGTHFIFPNLYGGLVGILIDCGINATVKWVNHPEKRNNKKEVISANAEVFPYDYS